MPTLPDPPPGCEITTAADGEVASFAWSAYKPGYTGLGAAAGLLFWLALWTAGGVMAVLAVASGRGHPFLYVWLCGWLAGEVFAAVKVWQLVAPVRPERVRLGPDRLDYDPGRGPDEARSCADLPDGTVVPVTPAPAASIPKARIDRVGVDQVNGRERLFLDTPDGRMEIGGCLLPSERAWLLAVLRQWLGAPAHAPWTRPHVSEAKT
jgi:hypothetical protein